MLDRAVHHPVVGEAECRHLEFGGARGERVDLACTVEQRVFAVDVQVDRSAAHPSIIPMRADGVDTKHTRFPHSPEEISRRATLCTDGGAKGVNEPIDGALPTPVGG